MDAPELKWTPAVELLRGSPPTPRDVAMWQHGMERPSVSCGRGLAESAAVDAAMESEEGVEKLRGWGGHGDLGQRSPRLPPVKSQPPSPPWKPLIHLRPAAAGGASASDRYAATSFLSDEQTWFGSWSSAAISSASSRASQRALVEALGRLHPTNPLRTGFNHHEEGSNASSSAR